jgi:outer membrane receptor protein involved in Fe transport
VPLSIKAFSGDMLERYDLRSWEDVAALTPGLLIQAQNDSAPSYVIRGIEAPTSDAASEPGISIFVNGVDSSRTKGSLTELFDIDRVEIAKGPQSTLYGRGAAVGAFAIYTRRADTGQAEASIEGEYGNHDMYSLTGIANVPIVRDKLAIRAAVRRRERTGYVTNLVDPNGKKLNDDDMLAARLSLRWQPTETITIDAILGHQHDKDGDTEAKALLLASPGGNTDPFGDAAQNAMEVLFDRKVQSATFLAKVDLGSWSIQSTTAWRRVDFRNGWDPDGTSYQFLFGIEDQDERAFSQEIRVAYDEGGPFRTQFGASWFNDHVRDGLILGANEQYLVGGFPKSLTPVPAIPVGGGVFLPISARVDSSRPVDSKRQSLSAYANVSLDVTARFTLEAGVRQSWDDADIASSASVVARDGRTPIALPNGFFGNSFGQTYTAHGSFGYFTPRVAATYKLTPDMNLYGTVSKGLRGGYPQITFTNPTAKTVTVNRSEVKAETIWSYEAGVKGRVAQRRVGFDLSAFYYDYTNFQTLSLDPTQGTVNAGKASAYGVEANLDWRVTKQVSLFAGYNYLHAQYDQFAEKLGGVLTDLSGNQMRLAPRHTFSIGGDVTQPVSDALEVHLRGTYARRSGYFFNNDNLPTERQEAFGLLNMRLGIGAKDGAWDAEIFGSNLTDAKWIRDAGNSGKAFGVPTAIRADPRFYGVRLRLRR